MKLRLIVLFKVIINGGGVSIVKEGVRKSTREKEKTKIFIYPSFYIYARNNHTAKNWVARAQGKDNMMLVVNKLSIAQITCRVRQGVQNARQCVEASAREKD